MTGGEFRPNVNGAEGSTTRMVTTDLGTHRWENLSQPVGLETYPVVTSEAFVNRMAVRATMDAYGIAGVLPRHLSGGTDAVLATRQGRIGVRFEPDGSFVAGPDDVFKPNEYLKGTFVNDVQDRRRRILQQLFHDRPWQNSLDQPKLLLWLNDWDDGFQFGEGLEHQGDTLLTVPLEFSRPPAGTKVLIPSPLISYATCRPPDNSVPATFWDDARHEWQQRSVRSTTWLSIQIPQTLLPLEATQVRIDINVAGLMGQIEILGVKDKNVVSLQTVTDPVGSLTFEIGDAEVLDISQNGELTLGVSAGVIALPESSQGNSTADSSINRDAPANYWKIDSLSVQVRAMITELAEVE